MAADIIEEWVEVTGVGLGRGIKGQVGWGWGDRNCKSYGEMERGWGSRNEEKKV